MNVTVVDYGRGNLFSIGQALRHSRCHVQMTADPAVVSDAKRIVLPGVGAFGDCMERLTSRGLAAAVKKASARGAPILGICVGAQVMLETGEEFGDHQGLGLVAGTVRRLPEGNGGPDTVRIPHVGWRSLSPNPDDPIMRQTDDMFYFVHSFAPFVSDRNDVSATIQINGTAVPVAFRHKNVVGVQFHPEKSGPAGLRLIERFLSYTP